MGLCTLLLFIIISPFIVVPILTYKVRKDFPDQAGQIAWDPVSLVKHSPLAWLLLAIAFTIGFAWKYRQLSR